MHQCVESILEQYHESLRGVRHLIYEAEKRNNDAGKHDVSILRGMGKDLEWTIEYLDIGFMPAYSVGQYKKIVPVDPQKVTSLCSKPLVSSKPSKNGFTEFLNDLFKILTSNEREALMLVVIEGLTYGEAAELMNVSRGSVSTYVLRAKNKLKTLYLKRDRKV